ncbi:MAG: alanine dehydrogenase [Thermodesulfobacteriota bacterium]
MIIGVPREIKAQESRVAMVPTGVIALVSTGHKVLVEQGAGLGSGIEDDDFIEAGAEIVSAAELVWQQAEMVVKVKEPLPQEYQFLREGLLLFTFLHLAPLPELTEVLMANGVTAIAYETVEAADGSLPLLASMSEVAGRLAPQVGAHFLERESGGRGILLGGVSGAEPGKVVVLGSGTVGANAAEIALGMGARVVMMGRNRQKLARRKEELSGGLITMVASPENIKREIVTADLVVGAVLVPGGRAPQLITRQMVATMGAGSVIVDVAIDQGGCVETARPTTHLKPTYLVDGVIHYCVANMPGAVPRTSTYALTSATLPFVIRIAAQGIEAVARVDQAVQRGLNVYKGNLINRRVAKAQGREWVDCQQLWQES